MTKRQTKKGQLADSSGGSARDYEVDFYMSKDDQDAFEKNARDAAYRLSTVACKRGATTKAHDSELNPCGLDEVLDMVFGEDKSILKRQSDEDTECA